MRIEVALHTSARLIGREHVHVVNLRIVVAE
jgi:hypothetical protein